MYPQAQLYWYHADKHTHLSGEMRSYMYVIMMCWWRSCVRWKELKGLCQVWNLFQMLIMPVIKALFSLVKFDWIKSDYNSEQNYILFELLSSSAYFTWSENDSVQHIFSFLHVNKTQNFLFSLCIYYITQTRR